jgi:hypothetical protein
MLFILAMEPFQCLLQRATEQQIISPLNFSSARFRTSFYADDAALFVNPAKEDITVVQILLHFFGNASACALTSTNAWPTLWLVRELILPMFCKILVVLLGFSLALTLACL